MGKIHSVVKKNDLIFFSSFFGSGVFPLSHDVVFFYSRSHSFLQVTFHLRDTRCISSSFFVLNCLIFFSEKKKKNRFSSFSFVRGKKKLLSTNKKYMFLFIQA